MKTKKPTPKGIGPTTTKPIGRELPVRSQPAPLTLVDLVNMETQLTRRMTAQSKAIQEQLKQMAKTLNQILEDAASQDSHEDSTQTLLDGVRQQVTDALAGVEIPPEAQTKLDQVFEELEANNDKVSAALTGDTPPPIASP